MTAEPEPASDDAVAGVLMGMKLPPERMKAVRERIKKMERRVAMTLDDSRAPWMVMEIESKSSPRVYRTSLNPPSCDCEGWRFNKKKPCYHQVTMMNELLQARCDYLTDRHTMTYGEWQSFEQVLAAFTWGGSEEYQYILNLILALLATGPNTQVHGDHVAWALGEQYTGHQCPTCGHVENSGSKKLSAAWGALVKKGLIQRVATRRSEREQNHGSDQGIYTLTEQGRALVMPSVHNEVVA